MKGVRIHAIVRELNNENIDVINYSSKPAVFIQRALSPAKLKNVEVDEAAKTATVLVDKDQVSLAIGRNGQNVRLASKLTGFEINLVKEGVEEEYDMDLGEFREELGEPLYERLVDEGYDTARKVIDASAGDLMEIEGLTEEKVQSIKAMMQRELEEADIEEEEDGQPAVLPAPPAGAAGNKNGSKAPEEEADEAEEDEEVPGEPRAEETNVEEPGTGETPEGKTDDKETDA
jgi:transcription antitermination factor NusA-like protein